MTGTPFKIAQSVESAAYLNSGRAGSTQVGKIATLYTCCDREALDVVAFLESRLVGVPGPVVDGDIRVSSGAPIYARWGAYRSRKGDEVRGGMVSTPDGVLMPDDRRTPLHRELGRKPPFNVATWRPRGQIWGSRYQPVALIASTAASSVYSGVDLLKGRRVAIKVRRARTSYDRAGLDACDRLEREYRNLISFGRLLNSPEPFAYVKEPGWAALVAELIPGRALSHPTVSTQDRSSADTQLRALVDAAHKRRYLLRDLRPQNVVFDDFGIVRLVDLEFVGPENAGDLNVVASPIDGRAGVHSRGIDRELARRIVGGIA
jgi:hypothetical protein